MTADTPNIDKAGERESLRLCYVRDSRAWFTSQDVTKQWGDDWNDAPYEHNAGAPYADEGVTIECVYFDADFQTPDDGYTNSPYSVERINRGEVPWLRDRYRGTLVTIMAGTTLAEFRRLVSEAGGHVYERTARAELAALKATASRAEALERVRIAAANVAAMYQTDPLTTVDGLTDTDFIMRISALRAALAAQGGDRGAV